jgi:hypothetical protein
MGRRLRATGLRSILLLAVIGTGFGVWQGVAAAKTNVSGLQIWGNRDECALQPHTYSIGDARLNRVGGKRIAVSVVLHGAVPNSDYDINLDSKPTKGDDCNGQLLGTLHTDGNGDAKGAFVSGPQTKKYFFVNAFGISCWCSNETDIVLL